MKSYLSRLLKYAAMFALMLGFAACSDEEEKKAEVTLDTYVIAADAAGAARTVHVTANSSWMAVASEAWVTVSPEAGENSSSVSITIAGNETEEIRNATVSFLVDRQRIASIAITQNGYGPSLVVAYGSTEIDEKGGTLSFQIASNGDAWEYANTGDSWLTETERTDASLQFAAPVNAGPERIAALTFQLTRYPSKTWEVAVIQKANVIIPRFITLGAPSADEINLGDAEDLSFEWTGTNISGGYILEISASADMSSPLKSIETADESAVLPSIDLDLALMQDNVASGAGKSFYWSVKPRDAAAELTQALEVRELKLKRPVVRTDAVHGDMLDAVFNPDLTVTDVSGNSYTIDHKDYDHTVKVVYNRTYQRYMAVFDPRRGNGVTTGNEDGDYYRFDYNTSLATVQPFMDGLADGHSFECLVKFDFNYTAASPTYETKFFSTQGSGGTGFLVTNASQATGGNALAFIPNIGGWKWTNSQIKPDGAAYYHLVGVWDKTAGKSYLYVDGVLKGEADAAGSYTPAAATSRWICIGGDAGNMNAEGCFKGNLVIARVYDRALTATEATALWNQAKP